MKNLFLIDANSLIHRAFHALPAFTDKDQKPTGALYGLSTILLKIIREDSPDYIAAFFDRPEPTFRKKAFSDYKIHRPKAPDELVSQIIDSRSLFKNFQIRTFEIPGYEADDLIGSAAHKFRLEPNLKITILTGDLDSLQLIKDEKIVVRALKKGVSETITYNKPAVKERYGILPKELPEYKGLVGDQSDNIPGVSGIGPKTASSIIQKYGSIENFLKNGKLEKNYEKILGSRDIALLSKNLATIDPLAPLEIKNLGELKYPGIDPGKLIPFFEKLGFKSLIQRLTLSPQEKSKPQTLF